MLLLDQKFSIVSNIMVKTKKTVASYTCCHHHNDDYNDGGG